MTINECDGRLVCVLEGHIDTLQSQKLDAELRARLASSPRVTFDLGAVTYVCSAFLRVCLLAAKAAGPGNFNVVGVTPPIKRVFMMAGMAGMLDAGGPAT